jgi:hypothetical protein
MQALGPAGPRVPGLSSVEPELVAGQILLRPRFLLLLRPRFLLLRPRFLLLRPRFLLSASPIPPLVAGQILLRPRFLLKKIDRPVTGSGPSANKLAGDSGRRDRATRA